MDKFCFFSEMTSDITFLSATASSSLCDSLHVAWKEVAHISFYFDVYLSIKFCAICPVQFNPFV